MEFKMGKSRDKQRDEQTDKQKNRQIEYVFIIFTTSTFQETSFQSNNSTLKGTTFCLFTGFFLHVNLLYLCH